MALNKAQRKKARRKAKKQKERESGRELDGVTSVAIDEAMALAAASPAESGLLSVELNSLSDARFVQKRIHEALMVEELQDGVTTDVFEDPTTGSARIELIATFRV